ncbi:FMN-binding protein [Streptomyces sp. NPDC127190]|uniref:FMN-binding protein n=1 Tax=unclassified Streptomyces TaxID=2593676 RepID=UPI003629690A
MRKRHPLRHALLATVGTVSGVVLLLALKPTTDPSLAQAGLPASGGTAVASASPSGPPVTPSPSVPASASASVKPSKTPGRKHTASAAARSRPPSAAPARTSSAPAAPKPTPAAPTRRSVTGATVQTRYGPVQVRITLTGSRITGATALRSPNDAARSQQISATAVPRLNQETLTAQSAHIDSVSGATYTSAGYKQSLQSALDQAGI